MKKFLFVLATLLAMLSSQHLAEAQCNNNKQNTWSNAKSVEVGGAKMNATKNIVGNLAASEDHTTLVAAVKAADLVNTLQSDGPFTVFAPINAAFERLPDGTVSALLQPENKSALANILTYHVVAGKFDAKAVINAIEQGHGRAEIKTVSGSRLVARMNGDKNVILEDENGQTASITIYDVPQSNGVVHVIDRVVLPKV